MNDEEGMTPNSDSGSARTMGWLPHKHVAALLLSNALAWFVVPIGVQTQSVP